MTIRAHMVHAVAEAIARLYVENDRGSSVKEIIARSGVGGPPTRRILKEGWVDEEAVCDNKRYGGWVPTLSGLAIVIRNNSGAKP